MLPILTETKALNALLSNLNITEKDRVVFVREDRNVDANFILTNLIKQFLQNHNRNGKICLIALHNRSDHYQIVGKKLGYDLSKEIEKGHVEIVDLLRDITEDLDCYATSNHQDIIKQLFVSIKTKLNNLRKTDSNTYLIVDDLSHLLDLGVDVKYVLNFVNYCVNLVDKSVCVVFGCHVASKSDEIISNALSYVSDVVVDVSALKTGRSSDVTGVVTVNHLNADDAVNIFHYKTYERGVRTFHPGESLNYLYK